MKVTYTELKGKKEAGYGVTRWANAQEINQSLKELTSQPIYSVTEEAYKDICENYYDKQCAKSKAITAEAKKYIPGGVQHNLAFNKPFPMCIVKAEGAYMYDLDGNKYIDFLQAGGPTILGSNYPAVQEEAIKLIKDCGPVTGLFHEAELLIAKEIHECMPNVEKFRMLITAGPIRWSTAPRCPAPDSSSSPTASPTAPSPSSTKCAPTILRCSKTT